MKDNNGSLYLIEAVLAITILLMAVLVVNTVISIPSPDYFYDSHDAVSAQDTMESLSSKIDFDDRTFLGEISDMLKNNRNSKKSVREVSKICQNKLDSFNLDNYKFCESNKLGGKVLAHKGSENNAKEITVATRSYGDYSYTLSVW